MSKQEHCFDKGFIRLVVTARSGFYTESIWMDFLQRLVRKCKYQVLTSSPPKGELKRQIQKALSDLA